MMAVRIAGMAAGGAGVSLPVFSGHRRGAECGFPSGGAVARLDRRGRSGAAGASGLRPARRGRGRVRRRGDGGRRCAAPGGAGTAPAGPKDGHAIVVANSLSVGKACLCLADVEQLFDWSLAALALNFEAFRANVTALDDRALAARPAFGQRAAAEPAAGASGRQLPAGRGRGAAGAGPAELPLRAAGLGGAAARDRRARTATEIEIASSGDNPVVLVPDRADPVAWQFRPDRLRAGLGAAGPGDGAWRGGDRLPHDEDHVGRDVGPAALPDAARRAAGPGFGTVQKTVSLLEAEIRHLAASGLADADPGGGRGRGPSVAGAEPCWRRPRRSSTGCASWSPSSSSRPPRPWSCAAWRPSWARARRGLPAGPPACAAAGRGPRPERRFPTNSGAHPQRLGLFTHNKQENEDEAVDPVRRRRRGDGHPCLQACRSSRPDQGRQQELHRAVHPGRDVCGAAGTRRLRGGAQDQPRRHPDRPSRL